MEFEALNDERRMWKYILFSILTFGIYGLIFDWKMFKDLNTACGAVETSEEDKSVNYLVFVLLNLITFSIYSYVWYYKQGNRVQRAGTQYKKRIDESGKSYLLWATLGVFLFGVGPLVAKYFFICNMNKICNGYNNRSVSRDNSFVDIIDPPELPQYDQNFQNDWGNRQTFDLSGGGQVIDEMPTTGYRPSGQMHFLKGSMEGCSIDIQSGQSYVIGRNSDMCQIILRESDISRKHCMITYNENGGYYTIVDYSTYGVIVNDSDKLQKGVPKKVPGGTMLLLGNGSTRIKLL